MKATIVDCLNHNKDGEYKLLIENIDDLWHLSHLISPGNLVFGLTLRTVDGPTDKLRSEKLEKKPVRIGIKCNKIEYVPGVGRLRVLGVIISGPDIGQHHTLNVEPTNEISIIRKWTQCDIDRINRAVSASIYNVTHIVTVEDGEIELYRMHQYGPERITTLILGSGKTGGIDSRISLFEEFLNVIKNVTGPIVVAGPGFVKEELVKFVKTKLPNIFENMMVVDTVRTGYGAVIESIKKGVLNKVTQDIQLSREIQVMDELFTRINKNEPVAYGLTEVMSAINYGAANTVIIADSKITDPTFEKIIEAAETIGSSIIILSTEFEPGKRLIGIGGIAALLRYKI